MNRAVRLRLSRFVLLLAAFAACVQWTIPHGWMVASAHEGAGDSALLVPCPATSPELAALAERAAKAHHGHHAAMNHGGDDGDDMHGAAQAMCDFAAVGAPVLPPDGPKLSAPLPAAQGILPAFPEALPGRGLAAPPPPSTGPPHSRA